MTADEIRALYVETLARTTYEQKRWEWADIEPMREWDRLPVEGRQPWLDQEEQYVDALVEAGLLPDSVEEQLAGGFRPGIHTMQDIENQTYPRTYTMRRYVTDWREVQS